MLGSVLVLAVSPWVYYGALNGADLATTWRAEARGCHEVNPLLRGPKPVDVLVKAAGTVVEVKLERLLPGKRRWVVRLTIGSITAASVAVNLACRP